MKNEAIADPPALTVSAEADEEAEAFIAGAIKSYNNARFGAADRHELNVLLRDGAGKATGGLMGHTARGWLFVTMLYVPEDMRGRGIAARLLAMAEEEAHRRGCLGAMIDTMNPDALRLYRCAGYAISGRSPAFDSGHCIVWLAKRFPNAAA